MGNSGVLGGGSRIHKPRRRALQQGASSSPVQTGRGGPRRRRGGRGAGLNEPLSMTAKRRVRRPLHRRFGRSLSPASRVRMNETVLATRSRPSFAKASPKNVAAGLTFVREAAVVTGFITINARQAKKESRKKRKRNAGRREFASSASCDAAPPPPLPSPACGGGNGRGRHACRRSTAALAKGTIHPQGSASGHASWDLAGALDPVRPPQPGGGDLTPLHGRYPRRKNLSQSSEAPRTPVIVPAG